MLKPCRSRRQIAALPTLIRDRDRQALHSTSDVRIGAGRLGARVRERGDWGFAGRQPKTGLTRHDISIRTSELWTGRLLPDGHRGALNAGFQAWAKLAGRGFRLA